MKILAVAVMACLVMSCEKDEPDYTNPEVLESTAAFEAEFTVLDVTGITPKAESVRIAVNPPERPPMCYKSWVGLGESPQLGRISVQISVLCNMLNNTFCKLIGNIQAEDGSTLFFSIDHGQINCNEGEDCDYYNYCFNNLATIQGGTGRFARAKGSFYPNALVHNGQDGDWNAKFCCKGEVQFKVHRLAQIGGTGVLEQP